MKPSKPFKFKSATIYLLLLILTIFCPQINTLSLDCTFTDGPFYSIVGYPYQCKVENTTSINSEYQIVSSVNGRHYGQNSFSEVQMLWITGTVFHYVPLGIGSFFDNLEAIFVRHGGLKKLELEKMKQFPNLRYLYLRYNNVEALKPDVFKGNPKLEWIDFKANKLKHIDGEIFITYTKLQNLNLKKNPCIDQHLHQHHGRHLTHDSLVSLKYEIDMSCHRPNELYCSLYDMSHLGTELFTCCSKGSKIASENVQLLRILHNKNLTNLNEVLGLYVHNQRFYNFPQNLHVLMPNLQAIQIINSGLKNLTVSDLKFYKNLKSLWLPLNHIQVLKNGVFEQNGKLEKLSLYGNQLTIIESKVLMPLKFLIFASFEKNECVDKDAKKDNEFEDLKGIIAWGCKGDGR